MAVKVDEDHMTNLSGLGKSEADSTMNDGQHDPARAYDGSEDNFWASSPGDLTAEFTLTLDYLRTVDKVTIKWKYPAKKFNLLALTEFDSWRMYA
jgi:hypothetical protein